MTSPTSAPAPRTGRCGRTLPSTTTRQRAASYANWNNPKSIDDFWHTAVNGRGTYFNAKRPESLVTGLADALADVEVRTGSGSGITVSNSTPVNGDNFALHDDLHHRQVDR